MKEMNKKNYLSPMVEIMNARVEKGFAGSGSGSTTPTDPITGSSELPGVTHNDDDPNTDGNDFD